MEDRCPGSKFITKYNLNGYKLIFSNRNSKSIFGHANIEKKKIKKFQEQYGTLLVKMKKY